MTNIARRSFLQGGALLPLAAVGGGLSRHVAALEPVRRVGGPHIKLALNAYSFSKLLNDNAKGRSTGFGLLQLVDFCALQGFDGLDATGYFFPGYPDVPDDGYLNDFKRRAFDQGVDISGTGVRNNFTTADKQVRADAVSHIKQWVEVAAKMGAPVLRVFADTQMRAQTWDIVSDGASRDDVEEWIANDVRECAEHGGKYGVIIGVQNHGDFLKSSDDHLNLIRRVDSPWCGPIVDTGYYKTDDPYEDITAVAPYAVNWQVKESPIAAGSEVRTDLIKLVTIVRLSGYRGYLPIETLSSSSDQYDPFVVVPKFLAELREAIEATSSIAPPPSVEEPWPTQPTPLKGPASPNAARPARKPPNKNKDKGTTPDSNE